MQVQVRYLQGYATDNYRPEKSAPINRLTTYSYFDYAMKKYNINKPVYSLNKFVHQEYAQFLIPRAVGYSAGLLNYFFRGTIELSLPSGGIYGTATPNGTFKEIRVKAKNSTITNEEMTNGTLQLVVKYRLAQSDPFLSQPVNVGPEQYIVVPEKNNIRSLSRITPTELTFDLTATPVPLWATDVYLQVVYRGQLGNETDAVAVGFKDISEPTPIDVFNNTDYVCLNNAWYPASDPATVTLADQLGNRNGFDDDVDTFKHNLQNIYYKITTPTNPVTASATTYDIFEPGPIAPAAFKRLGFVLTDYTLKYSSLRDMVHIDPMDGWTGGTGVLATLENGMAVKNQTDPDGVYRYPLMYSMRGKLMWGSAGTVYENLKLPANAVCNWALLPNVP